MTEDVGGVELTKTQLLNQSSGDPERRLLLARLLDKRDLAEERSIPGVSGFLSPEEQGAIQTLLRRLPPIRHLFFGGFPDAERRVCIFFPDWMEEEAWLEGQDCPVCALFVSVPPQAQLTHRDYLGSLMGLGLTREKLGDILVEEQGATVLLLREVLPILLDQWGQVGRYPLTLAERPIEALVPTTPEVKEIRDTVASLRLDAVVASGFSLSRTRAAELISAGRVMVNHSFCEKTDKILEAGDILTCRGLGKCVLSEVGGKSKKGRIIIRLDRYI
ncbi:MAG: binding protein [Firmicutes bacterium]|nr:binding protein [Bacillota bacterium]